MKSDNQNCQFLKNGAVPGFGNRALRFYTACAISTAWAEYARFPRRTAGWSGRRKTWRRKPHFPGTSGRRPDGRHTPCSITPNVFEEIPFPDPNDNPLEIADFTYSASRHGVPMISATINSPQSLQGKWNHKQVVTFRNTKFYITEIPSLKHDNANPYYRYEVQMYPAWNIVTKTYWCSWS